MKIECEKCTHNQEITLDRIIFADDDEELFATYLAAEFSKSQSKEDEVS